MNIAKRIEELAARYDLPVHILYFGDYDPKGLQIPESAMADIREWVNGVDLRFTRCGISPEHVRRFNIPEKFDKPGTYEWEALDDKAAEIVIMDSLNAIVDVERITEKVESTEKETGRLQSDIKDKLSELLEGAA